MKNQFNIEKLKFPIGKYQKQDSISKRDLDVWIATIQIFPMRIQHLTSECTEKELNWIYRPNGWSIKQVVHHCADSHINSFVRFKLALTEDIPTIKTYEEAEWAELPDGQSNVILPSLQIIEGVHYRWALLLKTFGEKELKRQYKHPEQNNTISLEEAIGMYAWHCNHHLAHIEQAIRYKGEF